MNANEARLRRAAESILENEALTADLDDQAAQILLDWGVTLAQQITAQTLDLDEIAAEEATYQPMRTLRKMLRAINQWAIAPDPSGLERILEQAALTYEVTFESLAGAPEAFSSGLVFPSEENPAENIRNLRLFIEHQASIT